MAATGAGGGMKKVFIYCIIPILLKCFIRQISIILFYYEEITNTYSIPTLKLLISIVLVLINLQQYLFPP